MAGFRLTTNNRMELLAVIIGLEALKNAGEEVTWYLYCADCGRRLTLQTHYSKKDGSTQYSYRCGAVSYTHLDVYKRQRPATWIFWRRCTSLWLF